MRTRATRRRIEREADKDRRAGNAALRVRKTKAEKKQEKRIRVKRRKQKEG